ncbi:MAG: hypothetical protein HFJ84_05515 [Clostridiales bacterium]|jgi:hypothetical protein|nr:hypothetical protein [Clostridiales bacterium]
MNKAKITAAVLTLLLMFTVFGCSSSLEKGIVGSWHMGNQAGNVTFHDDGTFENQSVTGTWTIVENQEKKVLILTSDDGESLPCKIEDMSQDAIQARVEGDLMIWTRTK